MIQSLQKPKHCKIFEEYAGTFFRIIKSLFKGTVFRVDVVFDRYYGNPSIKSFTREERNAKKRPICKSITSGDVPLPESWSQFINSDDNKADWLHF